MVVLAVRPQDAVEALSGLPFRTTQMVISVIAVLSTDDIARLVSPATRVVRAIPLPEVARRSGPIPAYPSDEDADALLGRLGRVLTTPTETALDAYSAVSGLIAGHLDYLDAASEWLTEQGVPALDARRYVATIFREDASQLDEEVPFAELADRYATVGGLNEQVRHLTSADIRKLIHHALAGCWFAYRPGDPSSRWMLVRTRTNEGSDKIVRRHALRICRCRGQREIEATR